VDRASLNGHVDLARFLVEQHANAKALATSC
jgi:hypothetical protein